eukprot:TRINITY_DN6791_c0_g1_i24.p1 TRINITY_DN6791_c0_g1~~TRINITY_DN6791_c0_g1_i24.p1  ORF type:complete len:464 (-),score=77.02 TRINITY_DN6791_c0_g1_i24:40-1431(-)
MKLVLILNLLILLALSAKVHRTHDCNFKENCKTHDYKISNRAHHSTLHSITLHLRQNDFAASCPSLLEAVSFPSSPSYGHHLTFDQLRELTWDTEAIYEVLKFLNENEIPIKNRQIAPNGEYIKVKATIGQIEKMFSAKFFHFKSYQRNKSILRSQSYSIPSELSSFIEVINGIIDFPTYSKYTKIVGVERRRQQPSGTVTPQLLWQTYSLPNETDADLLSDQAVFESGQSFDPADLTQFQQTYNLPVVAVKKVIGPNDPTQCSDFDSCGEASLDVQYIMAMSQAPTIFWSFDDNSGDDIFLAWIEQVAADPNPPQVFSISYGEDEDSVDNSLILKFNTETCKMGLRGITLFTSSGDDGVAGPNARGNSAACGFTPQYPAACPYVTAVGATMGPESGNPEIGCSSNNGSIITSGGGFSSVFSTPSWQQTAVSNYLANTNLPPAGSFNTQGRYASPSKIYCFLV